MKEQWCEQPPSHRLSAGALICNATMCLHWSSPELAAFIAREGATTTPHHQGSNKDSFQSLLSTLLYSPKYSAEPKNWLHRSAATFQGCRRKASQSPQAAKGHDARLSSSPRNSWGKAPHPRCVPCFMNHASLAINSFQEDKGFFYLFIFIFGLS